MSDKISPLSAIFQPGLYGNHHENVGVVLSERAPVSLVQLTLWPDTNAAANKAVKAVCGLALPSGFSTSENDNCRIMPVGPGRYLIDSDEPGLVENLCQKIPQSTGTITDLGHARVAIRIRGSKATWVLAKGIALDFHIDEFPTHSARATTHHEIGVTIRRDGEDSFELYVFTSFARAFWHWLCEAAEETGYEVR